MYVSPLPRRGHVGVAGRTPAILIPVESAKCASAVPTSLVAARVASFESIDPEMRGIHAATASESQRRVDALAVESLWFCEAGMSQLQGEVKSGSTTGGV